jgi:transcriptional regulator EpsA
MPHTRQLDASRNQARDDVAIRGEPDGLFALIRQSLRIERHYHLYQWLRGDLQKFLPHDILIAAWGDFALTRIQYDVISAMPGVRTAELGGYDIAAASSRLFREWLKGGCLPFFTEYSIGLSVDLAQLKSGETKTVNALHGMGSSLVHGIKDRRGNQDCLYMALNTDQGEFAAADASLFEFLLPFIDNALRRIVALPGEEAADPDLLTVKQAPSPGTQMSDREMEIMDWVRKGKTNFEIGLILDISSFTVKNHLQRIFRKLNVGNRAQAVAFFEDRARRMASS